MILVASLAAVAQNPATRIYRSGAQWIEESNGSLAAAKTVRVKTIAGSIKVQGGEQNNVTYIVRKRVCASSEESARKEFSLMRLSASNSGEVAFLRAESGRRSQVSADFEVHVPYHTALLKLDTDGGTVNAANISGQVDANTGGGVIQLDQIGGVVVARSGGGNIEIGKANGDVSLETGGGNIHVVSAGGNVKASSGGGDLNIGSGQVMVLDTGGGYIKVNKCNGQVKASTSGGNLELNDIGGPAQVETGGGAIHIGQTRGGLRAQTGAGTIIADLAASRNSFTNSRLETSVGDIIVYVPDDLGVTIHATVEIAQGRGITSDISGLTITRAQEGMGPREAYAEGNLNGGGPVLHVHTVSGNIEFRRSNKK